LGVVLPVVAFAILVAAFRFTAIRRIVGVVWDVGTFWPRRFHPLAPPAYAERAIPELVGHVTTLVESQGKGVVIVGHSQGAVLSLATALQLNGVEPHRLAALTHGSPVGRYYRRFWPGVFGGGLAAGVASSWADGGGGERWWNAFRLTDPIGGPLFTGPDERIGLRPTDLCLPDPRPARTGCPEPKGHLGHLSDPDVRAKLDELGVAVTP
jgi:pimeloyl-ACP methyl ester carboxylesterase